MSMILIYHFMLHGLTPLNIPHHLFNALNGFVFSGVNIFFLLSGYFTIRYSSQGLLKLLLTICFFGLVNLTLLAIVGDVPGPKRWMTAIAFPVTKTKYWFMKVYLFLYITAPILNTGLRHLQRTALKTTLVILIFVVLYSRSSYGSNSYLHGMYLYCLGYYIGHYEPLMKIRGIWWLIGAILLTTISGGADWFLAEHGIDYGCFRSYSNGFIFLSAVMLVLYFRKLNFRNTIINSIASASLGCYLLQDGYFGHDWLYKFQRSFLTEYGFSPRLYLMFAGFFIAFWIASWILTKFMGLWIVQLSKFLDRTIHSYIRRIWPNWINSKG